MDRSLPMSGTKTPPPSPTHHLRILPILPRSARRYPAFLVDRIDVPDKFAIAPLQSHTAEIRRSEHTSTNLARSRERGDIAACSLISIFEGNFASSPTSLTCPTPHGSCTTLLSPRFATGFSPSRTSLPGCNAHSWGDAVPRGSVQHVFSPPTRLRLLRSTAPPVAAPPG